MAIIDQFLKEVVLKKASDLHFVTGAKPMIRIDGRLLDLRSKPIALEEGKTILTEILSKSNRAFFESEYEVDFAYHVKGVSRFRVTMFHQSNGIGAVFRVIPDNPDSLEDLGLPDCVARFAGLDRGLILITGATGSEKAPPWLL